MKLTSERLRELLHYDPSTGVFTWRVAASNRAPVGKVAGTMSSDGHLIITIDRRHYRAHQLAWFYVHDEWPCLQIDHKDTVGHHNWIDNLRLATNAENAQNVQRARRNSKSGVLGVSWDAGRRAWKAQLVVGGRCVFQSRFTTVREAHAAYVAAKVDHHPFQTLVTVDGAA